WHANVNDSGYRAAGAGGENSQGPRREPRLGVRRPAAPHQGEGSAADGHGHDLPALVIPASRTYPVWDIRSGTLRAGAELWQGHHAVVSPAHTLAALGRFTLGDTH